MKDFGALFTAKSFYSDEFKDPSLDGSKGIISEKGWGRDTYWKTIPSQWWQVAMPGRKYYFTQFVLQKMGDREDAENLARIIKAVQFEYSDDDETWQKFKDGEWVQTGQTADVGKDHKLFIDIDPPIYAQMVRVVMDFDPKHYEKP